MRALLRFPAPAILAVLLCCAAQVHAQDRYVVVDSKGVPGLSRGAILDGERIISVPAYAWLRLLGRDVRPVLLAGPLSGRAGALVGAGGPARLDASLLERLGTVLSTALRVRGAADAPGDADTVDLLTPGTQCAFRPDVRMRRPHRTGVALVQLTRANSSQRASFKWPATQATLPWPETVDLVEGARYETEVTALTAGGALRTQTARFTLTLLPDASRGEPAQALQRLLNAQCNAQVLRLVESLEQVGPSQ